ncbi:MAG: hypothetical protein LBO80_07955 [Treponema sp.]|jgi:hypothetical protein|nr:hypothetical protein [Treponema sp.]
MKKNRIPILLYSIFLVSGSLYGFGEKTLTLGAASGWTAAETRQGIGEMKSLRPYPVLVLSSAAGETADPAGIDPAALRDGEFWYAAGSPAALDMALSFDEGNSAAFADRTGHYRLIPSPAVSAADQRLARAGNGAALFHGGETPVPRLSSGSGESISGGGSLVLLPRSGSALFAGDQHIKDFTIEFWLYPMNMENGEQILAWTAARRNGTGKSASQRILCTAGRNRLQWTFQDFFTSPDDRRFINLSLASSSPVIPKTWSHHLIRFDADTGLLEYLVNGRLESLLYATGSGGEEGEVYTPITGEDSRLILGNRFAGLMDEVKIHSRYVESVQLKKYRPGGRMETRILDLGELNSRILRIEASGGRTSAGSRSSGRPVQNEYAGFGGFRFTDDSALQFFIRVSDNPYRWTEADWRPFEPGKDLQDLRGRFAQLAAVFYPSGDGETTPYLDELRIIYVPDNPPRPPSMVSAAARDGAVDLSWRASPDEDTAGYLVYYGEAPGEYFGAGAALGASPVNAGKRTSLHIDGLKNGSLYYFTVAAYDSGSPPDSFHCGDFSREVTARPLRTAP